MTAVKKAKEVRLDCKLCGRMFRHLALFQTGRHPKYCPRCGHNRNYYKSTRKDRRCEAPGCEKIYKPKDDGRFCEPCQLERDMKKAGQFNSPIKHLIGRPLKPLKMEEINEAEGLRVDTLECIEISRHIQKYIKAGGTIKRYEPQPAFDLFTDLTGILTAVDDETAKTK